jgi:hypothetical protein
VASRQCSGKTWEFVFKQAASVRPFALFEGPKGPSKSRRRKSGGAPELDSLIKPAKKRTKNKSLAKGV